MREKAPRPEDRCCNKLFSQHWQGLEYGRSSYVIRVDAELQLLDSPTAASYSAC